MNSLLSILIANNSLLYEGAWYWTLWEASHRTVWSFKFNSLWKLLKLIDPISSSNLLLSQSMNQERHMISPQISKSSNINYLLKLCIKMLCKLLAGELWSHRVLVLDKTGVQYDLNSSKQKIILSAKKGCQMMTLRKEDEFSQSLFGK